MPENTAKGTLSLRIMKVSDLAAASQLVCEDYHLLAKVEGWPDKILASIIETRGSQASLRKQLDGCRFVVAELKCRIVGLVSICGNEIDKLYVAISHQRQCVGSALFGEACRQIKAAGHDLVRLGAFPSALPFYKKMGMREVSIKTIDCGPMKGFCQPIMEKKL